jgi:hypothetical protein
MPVPRKIKRSRQQEQQGAERLGGRVTSGSGNGWVTKNDVKTDDLSVEYKYTDAKSYSLKRADLQKAERQALMDSGREFGFIVGFGTKHGANWRIDDEYVVISRGYFESLRNASGNPEQS